MTDELWPSEVFRAAVEVFGPTVYNLDGRMRKTLDRGIAAVMARWRQRYEMNLAQDDYAAKLLLWAVGQAKKGDRPLPYFIGVLHSLVNDERAHAGFTARAGYVDVSAQIREAVGS